LLIALQDLKDGRVCLEYKSAFVRKIVRDTLFNERNNVELHENINNVKFIPTMQKNAARQKANNELRQEKCVPK
jgi:hypothetical protein